MSKFAEVCQNDTGCHDFGVLDKVVLYHVEVSWRLTLLYFLLTPINSLAVAASMKVSITNLVECLTDLSDAVFQNRVWTGKSLTEESTFSELVCQTFDDTGLGDALNDDAIPLELGADATSTLRELAAAVREVDDTLPAAELVTSPQMQRVRNLASRALQQLK